MRRSDGESISWNQIGYRYAEGRQCLASFLLYHSAEVLDGVKPGNLVNLRGNMERCGRNLLQLWPSYGAEILRRAGLAWRILARRDASLLLFIYRPSLLDDLLDSKGARAVLRRSGYPELRDTGAILDELQSRMVGHFPHEIGLFLGYPLKDVVGFMGWAKLPCTGGGLWKFYGEPSRSLALDDCFRRCRCSMALRLSSEEDPLRILQAA